MTESIESGFVPKPAYSYLEGSDLEEFMSRVMRGKCGACRFWDAHEEPTWEDEKHQLLVAVSKLPLTLAAVYTGRCKRNPPFISTSQEDEDDDKAAWPVTDWREWCGEYANRLDENNVIPPA